MLKGQWGTVRGGTGDAFMRDDRMGDVTSHLTGMSGAEREAAVAEKAEALALQRANQELWESAIRPHLSDPVLADKVDASVQYGPQQRRSTHATCFGAFLLGRQRMLLRTGVLLYSIIYEAWTVMAQGAQHSKPTSGSHFNATELGEAILAYDAAWAAYRAFGLAEVYAPSLYHPVRAKPERLHCSLPAQLLPAARMR